MTTYENNYITQAVLELTFDQIAIQRFMTFLWENVETQWFWHVWNQQEIRHDDIQLSDESLIRKINKWFIRFSDDGNGKKIQVTSNTITIIFDGKYSSQEIITKEFEFINKFLDFFDIKYINRFLVRYVNIFKFSDFPGVKQWDWTKYISGDLLANIKIAKEIWDLRQTLCDTTVKVDDYFLWLRYWIWNKFNPSPIIDWDFVLDIAVRSSEPIETSETSIDELFKRYKDTLNLVFENSITEWMRSILTIKK